MATIRGVIFDYGSTLITFDGDWAEIRKQAHRALLEALRADGVELRETTFLERLARKFDDYERKRLQNHIETTATAVLVETLQAERRPAAAAEPAAARAARNVRGVGIALEAFPPNPHRASRKIRALGLRMAMLSNASDAPTYGGCWPTIGWKKYSIRWSSPPRSASASRTRARSSRSSRRGEFRPRRS